MEFSPSKRGKSNRVLNRELGLVSTFCPLFLTLRFWVEGSGTLTLEHKLPHLNLGVSGHAHFKNNSSFDIGEVLQ